MVINYLANNAASFGGAFSSERLREAAEVSILGILAVFGVLTLIWGVLAIFKIIFAKKNISVASLQNSSVSDNEVTPIAVANNTKQNEDIKIAVITAAISAYISSDAELSKQYENGFKVVSFKRIRDKANWNSKK